jgi:acetoin utilization deacetylase AcuC-like enzyme
MAKYRQVREILQQENEEDPYVEFYVSPKATAEELKLTHCPNYVDRYMQGHMTEKEIRKTGFPWSIANVERSTSSAGGTVAAMRSVLSGSSNLACHIAGGTHHAFYDYGEGFCVFSDIAVASNLALKEFPSLVKQILIVDLDVHQGNGNAALFRNDPRVFTFSMHCEGNFFSKKEASDLDVDLPVGMGDEEYLSILSDHLPYLLDTVKPELVFFQAGVDIFEGDRLGKLKITRQGLQRRNAVVYREIMERDLKCVVTMGGG